MTYTPQDLRALVPPIDPRTAGWQTVLANHDDLFDLYEPTVAQYAAKPFATTVTGSDQTLFRFVSARGHDYAVSPALLGLELKVEALVRRTNAGAAAADFKLKGGAATVLVAVTATTWTQVSLTARPASADEIWDLAAKVDTADTLEIQSWVAYWVATLPGSRQYPSGFRQLSTAQWDVVGAPISTELAARVLNGPVLIAKDRPVCVFSHFWRYDTDGSSFGKTSATAAWGLDNSTEFMRVGRGRIPGCDLRARKFVVTYFMRASSGSTKGYLTIGAETHDVTANAGGSFELVLGPTDVDIVAHMDAVGAGWAYFERVQVWRQAA